MALEGDLVEAIRADRFPEPAHSVCDRHGLTDSRARLVGDDHDVTVADTRTLDPQTRRLVHRIHVFDTAPVGLTLTGPAYRDNPIVYANRTFRAFTGYELADLRGENPRLLQGPATEPAAVADLREAVASWNEVTVELTNYQRDGTRFRNRVTLAPVEGADGTVTNWLGVQRWVDDGTPTRRD